MIIHHPRLSSFSPLVHRLSSYQRLQRQHAGSTSQALAFMEKYDSFRLFSIRPLDMKSLTERWHAPQSLITFNAARLANICHGFLKDYARFCKQLFHDEERAYRNLFIDSQQMCIALEFFLQMDGLFDGIVFPSQATLSSYARRGSVSF